MMNKDVYIITCSKCDKENRYEDYSCVGPDQRESIIDGSIMTYTCPHCGEKTFLKHPLTYIDPVHHFIVQYGQDKEQFFHGVEQLRTAPLYKDYIFRYTDSWLSFKEKIMILENDRDDRLMELYKLALKNELDEEMPSLFLFNKEEEKELMIALNPNGTRAYFFNRDWYDIKENDPLIKKILKYDTSLMVDNTWAKRLYDYRISVSLCEVQTKLQVRTYLIPSYDHVDVGDYVYVYENGERVLGQVMTKNFKNIADVPDHLHFIEKAWNRNVAIIVPSVLFGFVHILGMDFSVLNCLLVILAGTMVGIMFSMIAIESNSVWNSGIVHAIWNIVIIGGGLSVGEKADAASIMTYVLNTKSFAITGGAFGMESSVIALTGYLIVTMIAFLMMRKAHEKTDHE